MKNYCLKKGAVLLLLSRKHAFAWCFPLLSYLLLHIPMRAGAASFQDTTYKIIGRVTSPQADPLFRASVALKGTTTGAFTDEAGKFSIRAGHGQTLLVSYTGYKSREVLTGGPADVLTIKLEPAGDLGEVIVLGYGTVKKSDLTGRANM